MYNVLIVDDEETIVNGLTRLLPWEKYGCTVAATANSGMQALQLVRQGAPHILFTDIRMPGMDGLALIAALRSEYPDMQIAILSGHAEFEYAQQAIRLGVSHYLLKPSKMDELEDALAQMTRALGGGEEAAEEEPPAPDAEDDSAGNFIIKNAVQYIKEHYSEKLSLPEVADKVYVSQWHLSKLIAKHTGQSFFDILNRVRIAEAKRLLANPALKIWEVSEKVGFSDVTHFSRIFKKMENQSANEYRNNRNNMVKSP